ncbi:MAG: flippase [Deltaproteobacteria bacterium]|nr:flippase [Deltaproteobacteria bacterium]
MTAQPNTAAAHPRDLGAARVVKNTAVLLALRVGMPMLSVALVLAVSRTLGAEGLGRYTLAFTFLYFCDTIAPLGLRALITREGARNGAVLKSMLANSLTLGTASGLLSAGLMATLGLVLGYDTATQRVVLLLSLAVLPSPLMAFFEATFVALERMEYVAAMLLAEVIVRVGLGGALLLAGYGLEGVMLAAVAGRLLACFGASRLVERAGIPVRWGLDPVLLRQLVREAPTFLMISVFATLYWRIDAFMLSQLRGVEDVGYYGAAWRLLEFAIIIPQSFCLSLYPQMASAAAQGAAALDWLGRAAARYLFAASLPAAVCVTLLAEPILTLLYGESFHAAAGALIVLMWSVVPYGWIRYHAYVLVAANHQRVDLALNGLASLCNIALNFGLIPAYGALGAALATLISLWLYASLQYLYLQQRLPGYAAPLRPDAAPLLAAALTGVFVWTVRQPHAVVALTAAPFVYAVTLLGTGFFTSAELRLLHLDRLAKACGVSALIR